MERAVASGDYIQEVSSSGLFYKTSNRWYKYPKANVDDNANCPEVDRFDSDCYITSQVQAEIPTDLPVKNEPGQNPKGKGKGKKGKGKGKGKGPKPEEKILASCEIPLFCLSNLCLFGALSAFSAFSYLSLCYVFRESTQNSDYSQSCNLSLDKRCV